jgi:hypothetical protein
MKMSVIWVVGLSLLSFSEVAAAATMGNEDVIKLVNANLDTAIIITAIANADAEFDTSAEGLIALAEAKVPQEVIEAMIKRSSAPARPQGATEGRGAVVNDNMMKPSEVIMIEGDTTKVMKYLNPQMRTAARGFGFGGMASYAVLRGSQATLRTQNSTPSFLVAVPDQAQAESYFMLASFAVRRNNSREVLIGGGYMSYSSGVHPDRVVALENEKAADQSRAADGFTIYRLTPAAPLAPGEYAVILYTGEMHGMVSAWFSTQGNAYFDFGVDP